MTRAIPHNHLGFPVEDDFNMVMKSVSVARLKSNLSQYLDAVKKGAEIIVTSHRQPVADGGPASPMNVYLNSSVPLRRLRREAAPIPGWGDWEHAYASVLRRLEVFADD